MSKPDDIPQGVWDTALDAAWKADGTDHPFVVDPIARAIMAEREACAFVADELSIKWAEASKMLSEAGMILDGSDRSSISRRTRRRRRHPQPTLTSS